ncbi:MAG: hypothetical protein HRU76_07535 [Phycisphaeraceae bacterium]|nr:MAG: hypothetical protein HRU76_07535 [Phycisphaeraceae bacterium]
MSTTNLKELDQLQYETLARQDATDRPKGYFFDGLLWGTGTADTSTYAGQFVDAVNVQQVSSFRFFDRIERDRAMEFPHRAAVFGKSVGFAWRGDPLRGVIVQSTNGDVDVGFRAGIDLFDQLYGYSTDPLEFFARRFALPDVRVEQATKGEHEQKENRQLLALRADGAWRASLTVKIGESGEVQSWMLHERMSDSLVLTWSIDLRRVSEHTRALPIAPSMIRNIHSDVAGMDRTVLQDVTGKHLGQDGVVSNPERQSLESRRRFYTIAGAIALFAVFSVVAAKEKSR